MRNLLLPALLAGAAVIGTLSAATKETSKEQMIASAESATSAAVGKSATLITLDDKMQLVASRTIGKHWTCDCGYAPGKPEQPTAPGFDRAILRLERPMLGAGTGGADYTLTAILAYPDGRRVTLGPWGEGKHWDAKTCEREAARARLQLGETLSIARLVSAECTAVFTL
jgi:hypothetical protein